MTAIQPVPHLTRDILTPAYDSSVPARAMIAPGATIVVETHDARGGALDDRAVGSLFDLATYDGRWYKLDGALCARPDPPIPICVGTNGPRALKVAARLADWWCWDGPWEPTYRPPFERLRAACEELGRPFEEITKVCELTFSLPDDPSSFKAYYEHEFYPGQVFGVAGPTPADVIREIETLVDVGVTHFAVNFDTLGELRRFVDEVVPYVRLEPA